MIFSIQYIKKLIERIENPTSAQDKSKAQDEVDKYIENLTDEDIERIKASGIDIFKSSDGFKDYIKTSTGVDDSIFSVSMDKVGELDLSKENIEKYLDDDIVDENEDLYKLLNGIYANEVITDAIDSDGDDTITNEEIQQFLKDINDLSDDKDNFTFDDFTQLIENINKQEDNETQKPEREPKDVRQASSSGGASTAGGSFSGGAVNNTNTQNVTQNATQNTQQASQEQQTQSASTPEERKTQLQTEIAGYNTQIEQINSGAEADIQNAVTERDEAKALMEQELQNDENIEDDLKNDYISSINQLNEINSNIAQLDSQIMVKNSQLTVGKNTLSSLQSALTSLPSPTGKEGDEEADAKLSARKEELTSQITAQEQANTQIQGEIDSLTQQKTVLEEQKNQKSEEGETLEEHITELESQILEKCSEQTAQMITDYQAKEQAIETLKTTKLQEVSTKLTQAQTELKQVEDEIQAQKNQEAQTVVNNSLTYDDMIAEVLKSEGGYVNNPADKGGATNYGITTATYRSYTGNKNADVRNITMEEVHDIYYKNYFVASGADKYLESGNSAYAYVLFDAAVNHGVGRAKEWDEQANGDISKFMELRKQRYISNVRNDSSQRQFAKGWQNRWNRVYSTVDPTHEYENYANV